jgi:hypothetical protein
MNDYNNKTITKDIIKVEKEQFRIQLEDTGYFVDMNNKDNVAFFNVIHLNNNRDNVDDREINVALTPEAFSSNYVKGMPSDRLIILLMTLAKFTDSQGFCFPSVDKIAELSGLGRSTCFDYLKKYANKKVNGRYYLYKTKVERGRGLQDINLYYLPYCKTTYADAVGDVEAEESVTFETISFKPVVEKMDSSEILDSQEIHTESLDVFDYDCTTEDVKELKEAYEESEDYTDSFSDFLDTAREKHIDVEKQIDNKPAKFVRGKKTEVGKAELNSKMYRTGRSIDEENEYSLNLLLN